MSTIVETVGAFNNVPGMERLGEALAALLAADDALKHVHAQKRGTKGRASRHLTVLGEYEDAIKHLIELLREQRA